VGVFAGPKTETDSLVFALDARNAKTYGEIPGFTDHGISDWYCFRNGTVTYSAIYPNTEIIEIDANGNEVGIVTTGSDPQRGTFSIIAGRRYYGTKAIHLLDETNNGQDKIAPVSFAGTYFGNYHTRNEPQRVKIYAPQDDITVNVYQSYKNSGGVTGTATSIFTISRGEDYEHQYIGAVEFTLASGGTGDYDIGETVNYEYVNPNLTTSPVSATVLSWNSSTRKLKVDNVDPGNRYGATPDNLYKDYTARTIGVAFTGVTSGAEYDFGGARVFDSWTFFETDKPAIMTVIGGNAADAQIMQPAAEYSYRRRDQNERTINDTAPSNSNSSNYVVYDTSLPVVAIELADGAGGDGTQGTGYEYLSDTFSWGSVLSDYQIVAPYADTTVTVSYWANSQWNVGEVHSLSGTQTNPDAVDRDGTNGFGVDGSTISGTEANLASGANLWKWESTKPIALIINDNADDEENMLGWMSNKYLRTSSNVTQSFVNLIDKDDRSRMKIYGKDLTTTIEYAGAKLSASDYIEFDGSDDIIIIPHQDWQNSSNITISTWVYPTNFNAPGNILGKSDNSGYRIRINADGQSFNIFDRGTTNLLTTLYSFSLNTWYNIVAILGSTGLALYINGELKNSNSTAFGGNTTTEPLAIGAASYTNQFDEDFIGRIASVNFYTEILTALEIQQNFNALRERFGI